MKVSELIAKLQLLQKYGDFEVRIQNEEDPEHFDRIVDAGIHEDKCYRTFIEVSK